LFISYNNIFKKTQKITPGIHRNGTNISDVGKWSINEIKELETSCSKFIEKERRGTSYIYMIEKRW
jgi:hypothetical protein